MSVNEMGAAISMKRALLSVLLLLAHGVVAGASAAPARPVVTKSALAETRVITPAAIARLERSALEVSPPWVDEPGRVTGVPLASVLRGLDMTGEVVTLVGSDGSSIGISLAELLAADAFLAVEPDGTVAIVYPHASSRFRRAVLGELSVRRLLRIELE